MRIAHVTDCYLPRTGGIESQVRALAIQQAVRGDVIHIITASPSLPGDTTPSDEGVTVHRVTVALPYDLPVHPRSRKHIIRVLRANPVDVVHIHAGVISPFAWGGVRAARELDLPTLITVHSVWGPLARWGYRLSDALIHWSRWGIRMSAVSDVAAQRIRRSIRWPTPIICVPNGIDPQLWQVEKVASVTPGLHLVSVMRLAPRKRVISLIHMVRRVRDQGVLVDLTIVGDGPHLARAKRLVHRLDLDSCVVLAGRRNPEGIRAIFAKSDAFIQPSINESFGLAALEARSAGLPVIARAETGTAGFIHQEVEGLIAEGDAGMVEAILRLATEPELVARISEHNQLVDPVESWPVVLGILDSAYARNAGHSDE